MSEHPPPQAAHWPEGAIFTLGHSTLPIERFISLLRNYGIERLVDIRTVPRSRHNPQFNDTALASTLKTEHIEYVPMQTLGGLRHARKDSPNTGWRNASFRGYADYMQTEAFQDALQTLIQMSRKERVAIMCAEAVPWRCHRSLVADALSCSTPNKPAKRRHNWRRALDYLQIDHFLPSLFKADPLCMAI